MGEVGAAVFLVDLGCLGVKDAFAARFPTLEDYELGVRAQMTSMRPVEAISSDLAAKIVREGIAYARSLGLEPHRDYAQAAPYLADANPDAATEEVPLGRDGKPYFVNGPHDNVRKIVTQLNRAVGPGNYEFLIGGLTADEMAELGLEAHASQVFPLDMPEPQRRPRLPWRRT